MTNYTVRSLASKNATAVFTPVGSAVLLAAQDRAQAVLLGARFYRDYDRVAHWFIPHSFQTRPKCFKRSLRTALKTY